MRVFQFHTFYKPYLEHFARQHTGSDSWAYQRRLDQYLADRFMAVHILEPAYRPGSEVQFTVSNDPVLQHAWAAEKGMGTRDLVEILLAQIEEHRAEAIYTLNPVPYGPDFLKRLPGCVKASVCWMASPIGSADLSRYTLRVCNFPNFLEIWNRKGWRSAWFDPAHDPAMDRWPVDGDRPVDVAFAGQYSRLHQGRNKLLEELARLGGKYRIEFALQHPRWRPLLNVRGFRRIPSFIPYLPGGLRAVSGPGAYGVGLYELFGRSKIVINAAIDVAGEFRGNMRCFESMGCGACMVSDQGVYPPGFEEGVQFATFPDNRGAVDMIERLLRDPARLRGLASAGNHFMRTRFTKEQQWTEFKRLAAG